MNASASRAFIIVGIFSALSFAGGLLKIPSPVGSLALDSAPGFFVAAYYGPVFGAIVGLIGHLASAATAGMPLGYLHLGVAALMSCWCLLFGAVARAGASAKWITAASALAFAGNGLATPFILVPAGLPMNMAMAFLPFVAAASALNLLVAASAARAAVQFRSSN